MFLLMAKSREVSYHPAYGTRWSRAFDETCELRERRTYDPSELSCSVVVMHFIRNQSTRFDVYISNRHSVIREYSQVEQYFYVETKSNPAYLTSRRTTAKRKLENPLFSFSF